MQENITLESLQRLARNFQDRQPAALKEIRVHPDYRNLFLYKLETMKLRKAELGIGRFVGVPILDDASVPLGEFKPVFQGDNPELMKMLSED